MLAIALLNLRAEKHPMAAGKNPQENDPHENGFFEDLAERVFKDYEPPRPDDFARENEDDKAEQNHSAA
jgi:hypothetical protein